jgi:hypothetical protein
VAAIDSDSLTLVWLNMIVNPEGSRPLEQYGISRVQFRASISEASAPSRGV